MIQQLLHIIIISGICMLWGIPIHYLLIRKFKDPFWPQHGVPLPCFLFFSGFLVLSVLNSWMALLLPLNFRLLLTESVFLLLLLPLYSPIKILNTNKSNSFRRFSLLETIFFILVLIVLTYLSSGNSVNGDTAIYHLQIVRWIQEQGTVPGLANLFPRLGLGSSLFNMISLFYIPWFKSVNFNFLNLTICLWAFTWLLSKWHFNFSRSRQEYRYRVMSVYYLALILYLIFDWQLLRDTSNSTAYDFMVSFLGIISISFLIEDIFSTEPHKGSMVLIAVLLTIPAFKLSGALIAVLILHQFISVRPWRLILSTFALSLFFITPILIRNHITTGYIFYPINFSIGHPDWQLPKEMVSQFKEYILNSNRFYNAKQYFIENFNKSSFNWIPYWWQGILLKHKILLICTIVSGFLLLLTSKSYLNRKKTGTLLLFFTLMLIGWFFTAPDPRFAYGFLLPFCFLGPALILGRYHTGFFHKGAILATMIPMVVYCYGKMKTDSNLPGGFLVPAAVKSPGYSTSTINTTIFFRPEKNKGQLVPKCYFLPIPCTYQDNPYLELRGKEIKDGFRMNRNIGSDYIKHYQY